MPYFPQGYSYEKRSFYTMWLKTGFDPAKRNECLLRAGYSPSTVASRGKKIEREVHEIISHEMDRQGMTLPYLVKKHKRQLNARHPLAPEMPDNAAINKALDMAYQIRDAYPSKKLDISERKEMAINITLDSLKAAEKITGEKIIDAIDAEAFEVVDEEKEDGTAASLPEHIDSEPA